TTTTAVPVTTTTTVITTTATTTTTVITTAPTTAPTAPVATEGRKAFVNTRWKRLRLRTGPGFNYDVITLMPKGTQVTVLSTDNAEWYHIRLADGTEGYSWSGYLKFY
ncbi:MAG: SH3 domain-containing protein, partial [Clostridia bacterium]|nr:SH3 domain-containing protein [Clostridia bacterium]